MTRSISATATQDPDGRSASELIGRDHRAGDANSISFFSVSPDDKRIAVLVEDLSAAAAIKLRLYVEARRACRRHDGRRSCAHRPMCRRCRFKRCRRSSIGQTAAQRQVSTRTAIRLSSGLTEKKLIEFASPGTGSRPMSSLRNDHRILVSPVAEIDLVSLALTGAGSTAAMPCPHDWTDGAATVTLAPRWHRD